MCQLFRLQRFLWSHTVEALICAQSWLQTSQSKVNARAAAEEIQTYEEIREEFLSKDCVDNQQQIDFTKFEE
ncbi:hypothetical protein GQ55_8G238700 [Panicum hallii var. hallii]|uniref:HAT C-terminal dimerisation domain-containing protein n=1 Tax=Panicum hallii var. hallii TaxID=1504633 RepID=A0A2T7CQK7_9POAL|nr:hypothetical protein GQ55_8G238700 [Panicum hallii var. hallii]